MTLSDHLDRLRAVLDAPAPSRFEVLQELSLAHAEHLRALGPVRVLALDPCPRCSGSVIASETEAKCAAGCDWTYSRHGGRP